MKNFINKFKNKFAIAVFGIAIVASAFTAGAVPAFSASCSGTVPTSPVFNYWPLTYNDNDVCRDLPLIDARDLNAASGSRDNTYSISQAEHDAGINANTGDQVRVSIYFHNGASDEASLRSQTTAHNVKAGSTYSTAASTVHTVKGSLSASNAATVTSESNHQGGNITITTPSASTLQYVSGSTQMCIQAAAAQERGADMSQTCGSNADGTSKILINLPDGIANGTVSLGDLKSCFPYSGEVTYTVNIVPAQVTPTNGSLSITKQVEDLTTHTNYSSSTSANQGDTVQYAITVSNSSNVTLKNVTMNEPGINGISFTTGNTGTVNIGTLTAGQHQTFNYEGTVNASSGTLTNTATASASNASTVQASAAVYVNQIVIPPPTQYGQLSITKQVRNLTFGNSLGKTASAHTGDQVQYVITVGDNGSASVINTVLNDVLPSGLNFVSTTSSNGNAGGNGSIYIGTLTPGQQQTVTITAIVSGVAGQTIINTATASAQNVASVSDTATVYVSGVAGANTSFNYSKSAFNDTKNVDATTVPADKEDYITYTLTATNTGTTQATNFVISDDLTNVLNYASMVSLNGGTMNGNTITWPSVAIAPNTSVNETFRVRVNYNLPTSYNNLQLVNTYGNTVTIQINNPRVLGATITAPTTGPVGEAALALGFAAILTLGFHFGRKAYLARKSA